MRGLALAIMLGASAWGAPAGSSSGAGGACAVLTDAAVRKAMGEGVVSRKSTSQATGEVQVSNCFYALPTFTNSVSVSVTRAARAGDREAVQELWERYFHRDEKDGEKEREREGDRKGGNREEEEELSKAVPVSGVGEEAFWVQSFVGNLYVLKGRTFLRISLGGKMTNEERLEKAKALAGTALGQLR